MAKVEDNKLKKRMKIINAAYDLFLKNGINTTPIDEVVKRAGVAKGTFYLYFRDKYDLFDQVIFMKTASIIKSILEELKRTNEENEMEPVDQIIYFVDLFIDYLRSNREVVTLIDQKLPAFYDMLMFEKDTEFENIGNDVLSLFIASGFTEENAKKYLYILTNMIGSVCCNSILCQSPYKIEEIRPELHIIIRRLLT